MKWEPFVSNSFGFLVVPRGHGHRPVTDNEVEVSLFEPAETVITGNVEGKKFTAPLKVKI